MWLLSKAHGGISGFAIRRRSVALFYRLLSIDYYLCWKHYLAWQLE